MGAETIQSSNHYAKGLRLKNDDGSLRRVEELVDQIEAEASRILSVYNRAEESERHKIIEAELCQDIANQLKESDFFQQGLSESQADMCRMLLLGYMYGSLSAPGFVEVNSGLKATLTVIKQQKGPLRRRHQQQMAREWMINEAQQIWANDHAEKLRIGIVVDEVKKRVKQKKKEDEVARNHWPESLEIIRDAIREVAPEYARKQGRPRKR
ncbi:hypothetical protein [Billgrantia montanilacus]|uniref:Uncharacterized protein n=1 Tax=Billgrantia montanilacus TaxID=2282305 RepID=A0A368TTV2_9GAMM|nr:hypothetical protein [Halomonas montanilacus]RCV87502.1 hypothetical protein DU505_17165 [Halomonas montanilacus]